MINKKTKTILIILSSIIILLIIGGFTYFALNRGSGSLNITTLPKDTTYNAGGKEFSGSQEITLKSGSYNITFSRPLFVSESKTVLIEKNKIVSLNIELAVDEKAAKDLTNVSEGDKTLLDAGEQAAGALAKEKFIAEYPIVSNLPLLTDDFRIDYGFSAGNGVPTIEITLFTEALESKSEQVLRASALAAIEEYGYDESKIVWYNDSKKNFE